MNSEIIDINLEDLKQNLKSFRQQIEWNRPVLYGALKPHVKAKYDKIFANYYITNVQPYYETFLTKGVIQKIANSENQKLSYEIYNLLIIKKYRKILLKQFPNNHPAVISSQVLALTVLISLIISIILFLFIIPNDLNIFLMLLFGIIAGLSTGLILGTMFQKFYIIFKFQKIYINKTYF